MNDKVKAIIAHITLFGWLIALALHYFTEQTPLARFYLRQVLGLLLFGFIIRFIPFMVLGLPLTIALVVLWGMSLYGAIQGEEKELPLIGQYFQRWFNFL